MRTEWQRLMEDATTYVLFNGTALPEKPLLLAGSFNPLHAGHAALLRTAEEETGRVGVYELSITNVDKPPLALDDVQQRIQSIDEKHIVVVTRASTFLEKAALFPTAWFVLGYDTAARLLSPAYHANTEQILAFFSERGIRFVVGGRLEGTQFHSMNELPIPAQYKALFIPLSEAQFRVDISSSQLRRSTP